MAGKGVELLVSPTEDETKVLASFAKISMSGSNNFVTAVQIAELALKHRKNKHGSQRIVVFVGSPLKDDIPILEKVGKQLRKNNVGVDVISMGEVEENSEKLTAFVNSAHSEGNSSHLIVVPPGVIPCDALLSSPVLHMGFGSFGGGASGGGGTSAGGGSAFEEFGGIDPNLDPDLAMAIRLSAEEARATEEARASAAMNESLENTSAVIASSPQGGAVNPATPVPFGGFGAEDDDDEEALMQQALALSLRDTQTQENTSSSSAVNNNEMEIDDDEAALQAALAMSLPQPPPQSTPTQLPPQAAEGFVDPAFVNQLLGSTMNTDINSLNEILGSVDVDINDPLIQAALAQMAKANQDDKEKDDQNKK